MALPEAFAKNILKMKAKAEKKNGEEDDASASDVDGESSSESASSSTDEASSDAPDMKGKPNPLKAWAAKNKK